MGQKLKNFVWVAVLPIEDQHFIPFAVITTIFLLLSTAIDICQFCFLLSDDFKPASVDTSKMATVDILPNNEVNVTVPHCDGAGTAQTSVFRGPKKPYTKECVLIIDHNTGEITLERLSHNIQLKKTR